MQNPSQQTIRNVAIVAHVDHGKTTLVDQLFKQSGIFRDNEAVDDLLMDSMDLERERGITIASKNGSFRFRDAWINIIDTPGHADFGGQVERVLKMADGALLLVDAKEGPMPQTYFVLKKALALDLPIIVVVNKIDKPGARCDWTVDQVFDLFCRLDAPDELLEFPVIYASARDGIASEDATVAGTSLEPLCRTIVEYIPPPSGDPEGPLQMLVSSIDYSPYLGRLAIGKVTSGTLNLNKEIAVVTRDGSQVPARITKVYRFEANKKVPIEAAGTGEIVAVAGMDDVTVGVTYTDPDNPLPLPPIAIDPPTISMNFVANDSPFAGREGRYVTARHLEERLFRETLGDAALVVDSLGEGRGFKVSGRGELHLSILIETMRRDGYEFQVTQPQVIFREENGSLQEPYEDLTLSLPTESMGTVMEKMGVRKGRLLSMEHSQDGTVCLLYRIPTRGLLGFRSEYLTDTRGEGIMNYIFDGYGPHAGDIRQRRNGVLVSMNNATTVAYALNNLQQRGRMFVGPGVDVYAGQIVGEHCRENDLPVNTAKGKKLTNIRAAGSDENILLTPPVNMSLEDCITYINEDEMVELTPSAIRLRKIRPLKA
ncbi:MAG: translational GTPase TypA [Candidatus Pacebacteria bacterium]|nr:translational GTPase TypA [Candidatus Paceibacterota bacterium]